MRPMLVRSMLSAVAVAAGLMLVPSGAQAQRCPASANAASAAVWGWGTILTGETVRGTHPCGRRIQCTGGQPGKKVTRICRWL